MAQKQLPEKLLDPDQAAHAAALDRLLRFIVFNDGCSWSSFTGHNEVVSYEAIYPDIVAEAGVQASKDKLIDGVVRHFESTRGNRAFVAGIPSKLFSVLIISWRARARDTWCTNSVVSKVGAAAPKVPSLKAVCDIHFSNSNSAAAPLSGLAHVLVQLDWRSSGLDDFLKAGIDPKILGQNVTFDKWRMSLGPGAAVRKACASCWNTMLLYTSDKEVSSVAAQLCEDVKEGDELFALEGDQAIPCPHPDHVQRSGSSPPRPRIDHPPLPLYNAVTFCLARGLTMPNGVPASSSINGNNLSVPPSATPAAAHLVQGEYLPAASRTPSSYTPRPNQTATGVIPTSLYLKAVSSSRRLHFKFHRERAVAAELKAQISADHARRMHEESVFPPESIALGRITADYKEKEARSLRDKAAAAEVLETVRKERDCLRRELGVERGKVKKLEIRVDRSEKAVEQAEALAATGRNAAEAAADKRMEDLRSAHAQDLGEMRKKRDKLKGKLEAEVERSAGLASQLLASQHDIGQPAETLRLAVAEATNSVRAELSSLHAQALGSVERKRDQLRVDLEKERGHASELAATISSLEAEAKLSSELAQAAMEAAQTAADKRIVELGTDLDSAKREADDLRSQAQADAVRLTESAARIAELEGAVKEAQSALSASTAAKQAVERKLANSILTHTQKYGTIKNAQAALQAEADKRDTQASSLLETVKALERKLESQDEVTKSAAMRIVELDKDVQTARTQQAAAEARLDSAIASHAGHVDAVRSALQVQLDQELGRTSELQTRVQQHMADALLASEVAGKSLHQEQAQSQRQLSQLRQASQAHFVRESKILMDRIATLEIQLRESTSTYEARTRQEKASGWNAFADLEKVYVGMREWQTGSTDGFIPAAIQYGGSLQVGSAHRASQTGPSTSSRSTSLTVPAQRAQLVSLGSAFSSSAIVPRQRPNSFTGPIPSDRAQEIEQLGTGGSVPVSRRPSPSGVQVQAVVTNRSSSVPAPIFPAMPNSSSYAPSASTSSRPPQQTISAGLTESTLAVEKGKSTNEGDCANADQAGPMQT
ncbi:uncharacterized protein MKK02DRAFT_43432 [Dioszegia hungarica]|uniref:Uncharacterized protein n=1 Tax=Dioszegia hungarica TaxID=4972 RepID=A0AA38HCI5_9TREE|nr:uncharacterized protein MKK02DRAFT_43432 [Dioszegia hungarica]KAI9637507.1 hypothetical protein MKK02DRAFT_43432 [Dioszegia hungarica]